MSFDAQELREAKVRYLTKMAQDTVDGVSLEDQLNALRDEAAHACSILDAQAAAGRIHWGFCNSRKRHLRAAVANIRQQYEAERGPAVAMHVDDGSEIPQ